VTQPVFLEHHDAEDEVKGICRDIIARSNFEETGTFVVVPALADYAPLIRRVFTDYGVRATLYPETSLSASPPVVAVLELLRCLDTDFERLAAAAALGSPFLPNLLSRDSDAATAARSRCAAGLNHYSRRAGIIKGSANWGKIHDRVLAAGNGELDEAEDAFLLELQACVREAIKTISASIPERSTIGRFAGSLKQLLGRAGFLSEADAGDGELLEDRKRFYDILDKLVEFERDFGGSESRRADMVKTLAYLVDNERHQTDTPAAGVTVVDITETLGIHPKRLYFCGLTETNLPGAYTADPILPDRVRSALGMPDVDWHRDWQRFHFRRNLESSTNPPFLSCHSSNQGQPVLPTPFLAITPTKVGAPDVICSPAEEQLEQGKARGTRFEEMALTVDFSRDKEVLDGLARSCGASRPISVTRLEQYRRCPYAFYIETVLGMETPEEPRYDVDARQWGLVVHLVMEKLYANGPVPLERIPDAALKALDATLKEVELPRFWTEVTRRVFANLLPDIVRIETELREAGFEPGRTELSLRGNLTGDISLRGRFDRIDTTGKSFRVLDYKTGTPSNVGGKAVMDGTHLQLPLYAWLFRRENPGMQPDNFGVYSLRDPRVAWFAGKKYGVEELIKTAVANAIEIVHAMRSGRFPAEPGDDRACVYCELGHTCGHRETAKDS
jgi:ATP-dependent helicase/DNAse subunit B